MKRSTYMRGWVCANCSSKACGHYRNQTSFSIVNRLMNHDLPSLSIIYMFTTMNHLSFSLHRPLKEFSYARALLTIIKHHFPQFTHYWLASWTTFCHPKIKKSTIINHHAPWNSLLGRPGQACENPWVSLDPDALPRNLLNGASWFMVKTC